MMKHSVWLAEVQLQLDRVAKLHRTAEATLDTLKTTETNLATAISMGLNKLARVQLDSGRGLTGDVQTILTTRKTTETQLSHRLTDLAHDISKLEFKANVAESTLSDLRKSLPEALHRDIRYQQLLTEAVSETTTINNTKRYLDIKAECAHKLAQFNRADYQYLVSINYGTAAYSPKFGEKNLDVWTAKRCAFEKNRQTELMLLAMQATNQQIFDKEQENARIYAEAMSRCVTKVENTLEIDVAINNWNRLLNDIKSKTKIALQIQQELETFRNKTDVGYVTATTLLATALSQESLDTLSKIEEFSGNEIAKQIVKELQELQTKLRKIVENKASQRAIVVEHSDNFKKLSKLWSSLDTREFSADSYRYRDSLNISRLITGFLAGNLSQNAVHDAILSSRYAYTAPPKAPPSAYEAPMDIPAPPQAPSIPNPGSYTTTDSMGGGGYRTTDRF